MKECYIVSFRTGVYDSSIEVIDKVFLSKESAESYKDEQNLKLEELKVFGKRNGEIADYEVRQKIYDDGIFPTFIDYNGAWYDIRGPYSLGD